MKLISARNEIDLSTDGAIGSLKTSADAVTLSFTHHPEYERLAMLQNDGDHHAETDRYIIAHELSSFKHCPMCHKVSLEH
ncbi:hypothetical protein Bca52824_010175 [Brassica carinata]|uniref:Uncharacterized protein n=1 Tax=Brassica carinata TaxID=52824 RepID=A0A8X8BB02_BRACI|nr:hypothetical protein Bca52824_010175 [Brassica carinata]